MKKEKALERLKQEIKELFSEELMTQMLDGGMTEALFIHGKATEDLEEALHMAADAWLDMVLAEWEEEEALKLGREEKEKKTFRVILDSFENSILNLEPEELKVLAKIWTSGELDLYEQIQAAEFVRKGWVQIFMESQDACVFSMSLQIHDSLVNGITEENGEKWALLHLFKIISRAAANLYGVVEKTFLIRMLQHIDEEGDEKLFGQGNQEQLEAVLSSVLEEESWEKNFWLDGEYLVNDSFESREEYQEFLHEVRGRKRWIPDLEELERYAKDEENEENREYQLLNRELSRIIGDADMADEWMMNLDFLAVEKEVGIEDLLGYLFSVGLYFPTRKRGEAFAGQLADWLYGLRRWKYAGYSAKELGMAKEALPSETILDKMLLEKPGTVTKMKKPGRNDPCPCGSGKKYKYCCGR